VFQIRNSFLKFQPSSLESTQRPGITLYITLLGSNQGWLFQWPSTGDPYYRIVLQGQEIARVFDATNGMQSYIYNGSNFVINPPPLEVMPSSAGLAPSEINQPYLQIQWYGDPQASSYQVQENSQTLFQIAEVGAEVYTWITPVLADGQTHSYQVYSYNIIGQQSPALNFDVEVVTPSIITESLYDVTYDGVGSQIVFNLA